MPGPNEVHCSQKVVAEISGHLECEVSNVTIEKNITEIKTPYTKTSKSVSGRITSAMLTAPCARVRRRAMRWIIYFISFEFLKRPVRRKISTNRLFCILQKYKLKTNQHCHEIDKNSNSLQCILLLMLLFMLKLKLISVLAPNT